MESGASFLVKFNTASIIYRHNNNKEILMQAVRSEVSRRRSSTQHHSCPT